MVVRLRTFYLYNGNPFVGKTASLYWDNPRLLLHNTLKLHCSHMVFGHFFPKHSQYTSHSLHNRTSYAWSFVSSKYDLCSTFTSWFLYYMAKFLSNYNEVPLERSHFFFPKYSQKTLHSSPVRARYGVSFASLNPEFFLHHSMQCCMKYRVVLDHIITALNCTQNRRPIV